jgi:hypothetical protein
MIYLFCISVSLIVELHFDVSFVKIDHQIKKVTPLDCVKNNVISGILLANFFSFHRERGILCLQTKLTLQVIVLIDNSVHELSKKSNIVYICSVEHEIQLLECST